MQAIPRQLAPHALATRRTYLPTKTSQAIAAHQEAARRGEQHIHMFDPRVTFINKTGDPTFHNYIDRLRGHQARYE
eukprot:246547-Pyramimonas_sp.AAC.1